MAFGGLVGFGTLVGFLGESVACGGWLVGGFGVRVALGPVVGGIEVFVGRDGVLVPTGGATVAAWLL